MMLAHLTGNALFVHLYRLNLVPLYVCLPALVWVLHDYFVTLEDEVTYIWNHQRPGIGRVMFFLIRYYTIFLVILDVVQIHSFTIPGVPSLDLCVATDATTRLAGALSLWAVEIIMQIRIYILYNRSKRVALINGVLFFISIAGFFTIMIINAVARRTMIANAVHLPLPGCPAINGHSQWALWIPAMLFEFVLFGFAIHKSVVSTAARMKLNQRTTLTGILLHENILYFLVVACLLVFNNLMALGATKIPWFGFGPFHAALGITTGRMMIHLQKFAVEELEVDPDKLSVPEIRFIGSPVAFGAAAPRPSRDSSDLSHDIENTAGAESIHEYPLMVRFVTSVVQSVVYLSIAAGAGAAPSRTIPYKLDIAEPGLLKASQFMRGLRTAYVGSFLTGFIPTSPSIVRARCDLAPGLTGSGSGLARNNRVAFIQPQEHLYFNSSIPTSFRKQYRDMKYFGH